MPDSTRKGFLCPESALGVSTKLLHQQSTMHSTVPKPGDNQCVCMCRCAVVLRDLISPYLLRRRKADVATQLPKKTETVLFCTLTEAQRDLYRCVRQFITQCHPVMQQLCHACAGTFQSQVRVNDVTGRLVTSHCLYALQVLEVAMCCYGCLSCCKHRSLHDHPQAADQHMRCPVCRAYLSSADVSEILSGQRQALAGIDVLRKICNHPDLLQRTQNQGTITYGDPSR